MEMRTCQLWEGGGGRRMILPCCHIRASRPQPRGHTVLRNTGRTSLWPDGTALSRKVAAFLFFFCLCARVRVCVCVLLCSSTTACAPSRAPNKQARCCALCAPGNSINCSAWIFRPFKEQTSGRGVCAPAGDQGTADAGHTPTPRMHQAVS